MVFPIKLIDCNELSSVSELTVFDKKVFILEDTIRNVKDKIYGETSIMHGKYPLSLVKYGKLHTWLSSDKRTKNNYKGVIMLNNTEGFDGVCFHPGANIANTLGCLLPICDYTLKNNNEFVSTWESSFKAYNLVYDDIVSSILKEPTYFEIDRRLNA